MILSKKNLVVSYRKLVQILQKQGHALFSFTFQTIINIDFFMTGKIRKKEK